MENRFTKQNEAVKVFIDLLMQEQVNAVINGELEEVKLIGTNINDVLKYLNDKVPVEDCLEMEWIDTNGWQVDFWIYAVNEHAKTKSKYKLSGGLVYGEMKFGLNDYE